MNLAAKILRRRAANVFLRFFVWAFVGRWHYFFVLCGLEFAKLLRMGMFLPPLPSCDGLSMGTAVSMIDLLE